MKREQWFNHAVLATILTLFLLQWTPMMAKLSHSPAFEGDQVITLGGIEKQFYYSSPHLTNIHGYDNDEKNNFTTKPHSYNFCRFVKQKTVKVRSQA